MRKPTFTVYRGIGGDWYWHLQARNGRIIADGSEGYTRKRDCLRAVDRVLIAIFDANVRVIK